MKKLILSLSMVVSFMFAGAQSIDFESKELVVRGCMDPNSCNYDSTANLQPSDVCDYSCVGCRDENYENYDPDATIHDKSKCKRKLQPCNTSTKSGNDGVTEEKHALGKNSGWVTITYNMQSVPDKLEVFYEVFGFKG